MRQMTSNQSNVPNAMLPRERANWFDTEGNLYVSPITTPLSDSVVCFCVSQIDRAPLDAFADGAARNGIASRVDRKPGNGEGYRLTIDRVEHVARELSLELPYIRSQQKIVEIRAFLAHLSRVRTVKRESISRALELASKWNLSTTPPKGAMLPMDRANWHETEGCLSVGPHAFLSRSGAELLVSQFELAPLQDFRAGCARDGISCRVYQREVESGTEYFVRIRRLDQIACEVSREMPFLRTKKAFDQLRGLIDYIWMPRRRISKSVGIARKVLRPGLMPEGPGQGVNVQSIEEY